MRILLLLLVFAFAAHAADVKVPIAAPPAWVDLSVAPTLMPTPAADTSHGYDFLWIESQVNVREEATYSRNIYRITSESALQDGGRLSWTFDPTYARLTLHHVRVTRDGVEQDRLTENLIKTIQQERDLDRHLLNGQLTAIALLDDIRVGDVVDYASTRQGWNPAYDGHYFDTVSAGWSIPVRRQMFRVTAPASRNIRYKSHGNVPFTFHSRVAGEEQVLTWTGVDLAPIQSESELPFWFTPYPLVRLTEFSRWSDVVKWAEPLYAVPAVIDATLVEQAARLTNGLSDDDAKAVAILQFVQQEVRYLGMELGAGSHRPTAPAVVLARRFGDCKDKTLLFCTLMRAAGLIAYPALLDTDWGETIEDWLPTPHAFDHVIACIPRDDDYVWVDPTLTYQQGSLRRRGLPDYRRALVIKPDEDLLTAVVVPSTARPTARIEERFDVTGFDQPARFQVTSTYSGLSADSQRRYFAQTTADQIEKYYVNYYASAYPGISSLARPTLTDDAINNLVTVVESYEVRDLWTEGSEPGKLIAAFYPKPISDYTARPTTTVRTMPLRISPADIQLTTTVHLPEEWNVTPRDEAITSGAFRATDGIACKGKVVTMRYRWQTTANHVPVDRVGKHVEELGRYRDLLGYTLTYKKPGATVAGGDAETPGKAFVLNWNLVVLVMGVCAVVSGVGTWMWRRPRTTPPPLPSTTRSLNGLRGWLILVGFGVTVRPFYLIGEFATSMTHTFDRRVWKAITTPGGESYQEALGPLIVVETIGNAILLAGGVLMIALFYGRKRAFPKTFIVMAVFSLLFLSLDSWAADHLIESSDNSAEDYKSLFSALGQVLIWVPYMLVSERVKATFVR